MRATTLLALLAVPALLPGRVAAEPPPALQPLPADAWDSAKARHLLARAGFGGTPQEVEALRALGVERAVASLVEYGRQPALDLPPPAPPPTPEPADLSKLSFEERQKVQQQRRQEQQQHMARVRQWWAERMVKTPRPLEEKLTLFWHGHFAAEYRTVQSSRAMLAQNELFRKHAAGNFGKLLHAVIHDPAMLRYLDNNRNTKGRPNENLAREIMELFAMGVDQGYTENDIKEGARALTGHTFDPRTWEYRYNAAAHDRGPKTIFGRTGTFDGDRFVDLILEQPATARFIARKLFVFFAHGDPAPAVIDRLAAVLRANDYELAPVLTELFRSEEFYSARSVGTQIKSPIQLAVGTARVLGVKDVEPQFVVTAAQSLGQELFGPPNVKGWDGGRAWVNTNTVVARANFPAQFLNRVAPVKGKAPPKFDAVAYLDGAKADTPEAVVDHFARALFAVPLPAETRKELTGFLRPLPPPSAWADRKAEVNARLSALLVLMMGLPEYQLT
jgi:uncharacterized protein (DUF1800 family)